MKQISFATAEHQTKKRVTRREKFLAEMNQVVPWARLIAAVEPYYPTGKRGRPPIGLERMLRLYFVQQWYGLADEALEDAVSDSAAIRSFVGIDLGREEAPDATTVLKFRRRLEDNRLTEVMFAQINAHLSERGLMMREGTMVDATIINAPSSTKNERKERDPEMHQTKKRNQWYFGMKAHIGADADSGLVHSVHVTSANESDVAHTHELLHGQESEVFADASYVDVEKREEIIKAQEAGDIQSDVKWNVAMGRAKLKGTVAVRATHDRQAIGAIWARTLAWSGCVFDIGEAHGSRLACFDHPV